MLFIVARLSKRLRQVARAGVVVIALLMASVVNSTAVDTDEFPANSDTTFKVGLAAFKAGDYGLAFKEWEPIADLGHAEAQYQLGNIYAWGLSRNKDYKKAVKWFTLAADQGDVAAQAALGFMYDNGRGVTQSYKQAVMWYTLAADQENVDAQFNLGVMYQFGLGTTKDYNQAFKWHTLAANQGMAQAQKYLADLYRYDEGVTQSYKQAVMWYTLAANQGNYDAQDALGSMYSNGVGVIQDYTQAIKWYKISAAQGSSAAPYYLKILLHGEITDWSLEDKEAMTVIFDLDESIKKYVTAKISYSKNGNRLLYYRIHYNNFKCEITKESKKPSISIWYFNNQAVKMNTWCEEFTNSENNYLSFTPKSIKGSKFVEFAFHSADSTVLIKTDTLNFKMSAKGFTKVWNSLSSEAL